MIIGNNNNFSKNRNNPFHNENFNNKNTGKPQQMKNIFTQDIKTKQHINPLDKNEMYDKTLALLHERLMNNTISLEEFNRQCRKLGEKRRQS